MSYVRRTIVLSTLIAVVFGVLEAGSFLMRVHSATATTLSAAPQSAASSDPYCDTTRPKIIGHRGNGFGTRWAGGQRRTEDTIPAFKFALRSGADGFETDYSLARTNELVSMHNRTLNATTSGTGRVSDRSYRYIYKHRADSGARVPTFNRVESVMASYGGYRQQELKPAAWSDEQFWRMMVINKQYVRDVYCKVLFTASEMQTLRRVNAIDSNFQVGYITRSGCGRPDLSTMPSFVDVIMIDSCAVSAEYVTSAKARGMQVSARGVDTVSEYRRVVRLGVTRVVTNKPALLARNR
jgi:glycerophosphoryl diester phosphodiesterase